MGLFYNEQDVRYEAVLEMVIEYRRGFSLESSVRAEVMRSRTAPESTSIDDRDQLFLKSPKTCWRTWTPRLSETSDNTWPPLSCSTPYQGAVPEMGPSAE